MNKFDNDMSFGLNKEDLVLNYLNNTEYLKNPLEKSLKKTAPFDYYNDTTFIELKSRRNTYLKYPTTMVGDNKLKIAEEDTTKKYFFYFYFTDGLYKWAYNSEQYELKEGGRRDRGRPEIKLYGYIPIVNLIFVSKDLKIEKEVSTESESESESD